jgi:hypothetical protein
MGGWKAIYDAVDAVTAQGPRQSEQLCGSSLLSLHPAGRSQELARTDEPG